MVNHPGTSRELLPGKVLRDRRKKSYQQSLVGVRAWSRSWGRGWGTVCTAVKTVVGLEGSKKCFNWLLPCTPLPEPLFGPEIESQRASLLMQSQRSAHGSQRKKNSPDGKGQSAPRLAVLTTWNVFLLHFYLENQQFIFKTISQNLPEWKEIYQVKIFY